MGAQEKGGGARVRSPLLRPINQGVNSFDYNSANFAAID